MIRWRARFVISSFSEVPDHFTVEHHECLAIPLEKKQTGLQSTLVDIFIENNHLEEAYFHSVDMAEELTDRLSFLSYGPAFVEMISVTVPEVRINEQFQIAVPIASFQRSCVRLSPSDIESLDQKPNSETSIALRMFRKGLSSNSPYQVLADLWTSIETISAMNAKEEGNFVEHACPQCQYKRQAGPASQRYIRRHFIDAKSATISENDAVSLANKARDVRGKLIHGGRLQDSTLRHEVENSLPSLQASAATALVKQLDIRPKSSVCQHIGLPYLSLEMLAAGPENFKPVEPLKLKFPMGISQLPNQFSDAQHVQIDVGIALPMIIRKEGLPIVTHVQ